MYTCIRCEKELTLFEEIQESLCLECENRFRDIELKTNNWDVEPDSDNRRCMTCGVYCDECVCSGGYDE